MTPTSMESAMTGRPAEIELISVHLPSEGSMVPTRSVIGFLLSGGSVSASKRYQRSVAGS